MPARCWRCFGRAEPHVPCDPEQDAVRPLGVAARLLGPVAHLIRRPRRMFAVGFLFGLGLDTAATVIALVLGAGMLGGGLAGVLVLPLAFTAGMALADSADGVAMARIYRWASDDRASAPELLDRGHRAVDRSRCARRREWAGRPRRGRRGREPGASGRAAGGRRGHRGIRGELGRRFGFSEECERARHRSLRWRLHRLA